MMTLLVALHLISMPDRTKPKRGGNAFDRNGRVVRISDAESAPAGGFDYRLNVEKQIFPGTTFDLVEGGAAEGARLIAMGAARLPTVAEIAAYEAPK